MAKVKGSKAVKSGYGEQFSPAFQTHALAVLARKDAALTQFRTAISPEYFESEITSTVADALITHVDKYKSLPSKSVLIDDVRQAQLPQVWDKQKEHVTKLIGRMFKDDISDAASVLDKLSAFGQYQAVKNAVLESAKNIQLGHMNKLVDTMKSAVQVGQAVHLNGIDYGLATLDEQRAWYDESGDTIPTGFSLLDAILGGGMRRGELWAVLAAAKRGKTTALINMGYGAAVIGANVVHLSCELGKSYVARRYDARIAGLKVKYLKDNPAKYMSIVASRRERLIAGSLYIDSFPTRTLRPSSIRRLLDHRDSLGVKTDLLLIDYADLMCPESRLDDKKHDQIAGLYEDVRGIAGEYNCVAVSPSQLKQSAFSKELVDLSDFAEAFEKAAIIDGGIALVQTDEEALHHECRIAHVASRNSACGSVIRCKIDRSRCYIENMEVLDPSVAIKKSSNRKERFSKTVPNLKKKKV